MARLTAGLVLAAVTVLAAAGAGAAEPGIPPGLQVWPSEPPAGFPFARSPHYPGLGFTGRHANYAHGDTWYPSWAADGNLYSPWADGLVNGLRSRSEGKTNPLTLPA